MGQFILKYKNVCVNENISVNLSKMKRRSLMSQDSKYCTINQDDPLQNEDERSMITEKHECCGS